MAFHRNASRCLLILALTLCGARFSIAAPNKNVVSRKFKNKAIKTSPWLVKARGESTLLTDSDSGKEDISNLLQFQLGHIVNKVEYSFIPGIMTIYDRESGESRNGLSNTILQIAKEKLFSSEISNSDAELRFFIPTGFKYQDNNTKGMISLGVDTQFPITFPFSLILSLNPQYFFQSQRSKISLDDVSRLIDEPKGLPSFRFKSGLTAIYKLNSIFSFEPGFGLDHSYKYSDPNLGLALETEAKFELSIGLRSRFKKGFLFAAIQQKHDLNDDLNYSFLASKETALFFRAAFSLL